MKDGNGKDKNDKKSNVSESKEEVENEIEALKVRLAISNQSRDEFKEKLKLAEKEIEQLRGNDPTNTKKDK